MQPSASPWRSLAWLALVGLGPALGCVTQRPRPPLTYCLGRYEVQAVTAAAARQQARDASEFLAARLGRKVIVFGSVGAIYRAVLDDDRVDSSARVKVIITHHESPVWWVSLSKTTAGEDERVRIVRAQVEQALRAQGFAWSYDLTDPDLNP